MNHYIEQLYTQCLAEAAYYIESNGEAAIIDPLRETEPYLDLLQRRGTKLRYVIETHFHADFVSGHLDLARLTGAEIVYGPGAQQNANFPLHEATDGERLPLGAIQLQVLHTPGHTLESSCFLLHDERGLVASVFTGDTLFVGDVGRPDLAVRSDLSREELASMLFDSIQRLKALPDHVVVYPGHGAGSACGKHIGTDSTTTIGAQRQFNYALRPLTREQFVAAVLEGQTAPPKYFFNDAVINKQGYAPIAEVLARNLQPLSAAAVAQAVAQGTLVLDTRQGTAFAKGHLPGSVNVGLGGQYAIWVGTLFDVQQPIIVVADAGFERESVLRLARVGFENVQGVLDGGFAAWQAAGQPVSTLDNLSAEAFAERLNQPHQIVLDVRELSEVQRLGAVVGSQLLPVAEVNDTLARLDRSQTYLVHCAGGYRSMIAASLMLRAGFTHVSNVAGGFTAIKAAGIPIAQLATA